MVAVYLLGYGALALVLCPLAVLGYRVADAIWLERITRTPWDDVR